MIAAMLLFSAVDSPVRESMGSHRAAHVDSRELEPSALVGDALDFTQEEMPTPAPRSRSRSALLEDVGLALDQGEDSDHVAVRTSTEERILRSWRVALAAEGSLGAPILKRIDHDPGGEPRVRGEAVFEILAGFGKPLGRIRVGQDDGRWRLLEVIDLAHEAKEQRRREDAYAVSAR